MENAQGIVWRRLAQIAAVAFCGLLTGCTSKDAPPLLAASFWFFDDHEADLRVASCPDGTVGEKGAKLTLKSDGVALDTVDPLTDLPFAVFAGGWHLTSPDPGFGGLSGLAVDPDGNLLATSDEGAFVWIEMLDDAPTAARIAQMRDAAGDVITDKQWRDAEGLDLRDGIAFVSFEREHRVLAFNLAGCGAAARGVDVARFGSRIAGMTDALPANGGAEGLVLTAEGGLLLAIETPDAGLPIAQLDALGNARLVGRIARRGAPVLTGIDRLGDTLYAVLRSYTPLLGNTIEVIAFPLPGSEQMLAAQRIIHLEPQHGTDNFEGIALQRRDDGGLRLWLVSDDNFSSRQRTLLYAFDLHSPISGTEL